MELPHNKFKAAIAAGKPQIGFWCGLGSALATEVVGGAGFDWVVIDQEHTINDIASTLQQLQALGCTPATPLVRLPWNDPVHIKKVLDIGAISIIVPFVETAAEAAAAVAATRYPPQGKRGVYLASRGRRFGRVADYYATAHTELCVIVQIETGKGLDNLEQIAAVEGIDGVFIGPTDLSADLGHIANPGHPDVRQQVLEAAHRLQALKCPAGTMAFADLGFADLMKAGFTFVSVGSDFGVLTSQTDALAKQTA